MSKHLKLSELECQKQPAGMLKPRTSCATDMQRQVFISSLYLFPSAKDLQANGTLCRLYGKPRICNHHAEVRFKSKPITDPSVVRGFPSTFPPIIHRSEWEGFYEYLLLITVTLTKSFARSSGMKMREGMVKLTVRVSVPGDEFYMGRSSGRKLIETSVTIWENNSSHISDQA